MSRWLMLLCLSGCAEYVFSTTPQDKDTDLPLEDTVDTVEDEDTDPPVVETGWPEPVECVGGAEGAVGDWAAVAAGDAFTCALGSDGTIHCFGADNCGQVSGAPTTDGWVDVTAGGCHACAVDCNNRLECWGLYVGTDASEVEPEGPFTDVDAGLVHTCAVRESGRLTCWGFDEGNGALEVPTIAGRVIEVDASYGVSCALTEDGALNCWGDSARLESWTGLDRTYVTMDIHASTLCALDADRRAVCRGPDAHGELAGITGQAASGLLDVSVGSDFVCAIQINGGVQCWGDDTYGQTSTPVRAGFTDVVTGVHHACALHDSGTLTCWGRNDSGQVALPSR